MVNNFLSNNIFLNKKILVTGHTGFKGSWLCILLNRLGADIYGYALAPPTDPSLFVEAKIEKLMSSFIGDIRDFQNLKQVLNEVKPEIIIHMAAQPLVRESYRNPIETYSTNVMGTVNLLEAIRQTECIKVLVNVTSDKCYENKEWHWGYRENESMGGYDPYSNSKGCSELVTASYRNSFFNPKNYSQHGVTVATARAGNVVGGGDWADDRLIPDFIRSISKGEKLKIRSPYAIRPWQHVLDPLSGYLTLVSHLLLHGSKYAEAWNFGPKENDDKNVEWIASKICSLWGENVEYEIDSTPQPHEANYLKLDCSKAKVELGWSSRWDIETSLAKVVEWTKAYNKNADVRQLCVDQIIDFFNN